MFIEIECSSKNIEESEILGINSGYKCLLNLNTEHHMDGIRVKGMVLVLHRTKRVALEVKAISGPVNQYEYLIDIY